MSNIKKLKKDLGIQTKLFENVEYRLFDKNGNLRPLFKLNRLGMAIMVALREKVGQPIDPVTSQVKDGWLNRMAAYGVRIPFITGQWVNVLSIPNLMTNTGFAGIASRINGSGGEAAFTYIAMGTGVTAAAVTDTALQAELSTLGLSRANSTASRYTTTVTNDSAQLVNTFAVTGTAAVTESGILNAASVGTLLCRQVFSAINVVNTDNLQITWRVKAA